MTTTDDAVSAASPSAPERGPEAAVTAAGEGAGTDRLRVLMLVNAGGAFEPAWADAAATRVDLVRVRLGSEAAGTETGLAHLRRVPGAAGSYQLAVGPRRPRAAGVGARLGRALGRGRENRRLVRALARVQADEGPFDLLHGHFSASASRITRGARALGVPYVITEHSTSFSGRNPANPLSRRGLVRTRRACAGAGAVIAVSEELERAMRSHGVEAAFHVLANPVDTRIFGAPAGLPAGPTIELTCVARLAQVKGHDLLLAAMADLRPELPQLRLTIVGGGPEADDLEGRARRLGLAGIVTFAGRLPPDAVAERLRASHAFVLASRWENLSVATLEACITGLPCVLTRVGGLPEIQAEGLTFVEPDDLAGLTAAIRAVVTDLPDLATRRRRAESARGRYSVEAVGARLEQIYRQVLDRAG